MLYAMLYQNHRAAAVLVAALALPTLSDQARAQDIHNAPSPASAIDIADARILPLGTTVTIEGSVTVPSGRFASSTFDQGFAIQDETAGMYVSIAEDPGLKFYRRVRVSGVLDDDGFGLLVARPASLDDIQRVGGAARIRPARLATGDITEASEGLLVVVEGVVTQAPRDDTPFGNSVFIDDGSGETQIFIPVTTGVNPFDIRYIELGARIRVIGFSAQFLQQYEVLPRFRGDIRRAR